MFATQRQERILDQVRASGSVRVADLVDELGVSDMTIRRDISALAAQGVVKRVHGGATSVPVHGSVRPGYESGPLREADPSAIARAAASLVEPGSSVALSGGATTREVAEVLRSVPNLTVFTTSLSAAEVLHATRRDDLTVVLTGGTPTANGSLAGPWATAALRGLHVDWAILGAEGLDEQAGVTVASLAEAETDRALMAAGSRVAFAIDSQRWQTVSLSTVASLEEIDVLVTDPGLSRRATEILSSRVQTLVLAEG